jgi:hypothetical protein
MRSDKRATDSKNYLSKCLAFVFIFISPFITGCGTIPVLTRGEAEERPCGRPFTKDVNYIVLAHYWEDYAPKYTLDFKNASFLSIREDEGVALIQIKHPSQSYLYGQIVLKKIDEKTTSVTSYGWGGEWGYKPKILKWEDILFHYPALKK